MEGVALMSPIILIQQEMTSQLPRPHSQLHGGGYLHGELTGSQAANAATMAQKGVAGSHWSCG